MEKENSFGATKVPMMVTFTRTISMVMESTFGQMAEFTMDSGLTIKWKAKELSPGVMDEDTSDNTKMIRSMVREHLSGQTAENILVNGTKANNTVMVFI